MFYRHYNSAFSFYPRQDGLSINVPIYDPTCITKAVIGNIRLFKYDFRDEGCNLKGAVVVYKRDFDIGILSFIFNVYI